jgi:7-cyano-7-deazaguanine synthase in queuosine biosynthesis
VALLFSGGAFSTAMLLNLFKKGYIVTPYYVSDSNFEGTERECKIARGIIRIAKTIAPDQVEDLEIIETKLSRQMLVRRRRRYVELLTQELVGKGFNAIAYGCPLVFNEELDEDENADTDVMFLQELTPLQIVSPETFDKSKLEDMLEGVNDPESRSMIYLSTQCKDPGSRECGDCPTCIRRFRLLTRMWGEPNRTKYMKGSKVRGMKKQIADLSAAAAQSGTSLDNPEIQSAIAQILKPKKPKKDED